MKIPWRRDWLPTPVFWPGEFHGQSMGSQRVGRDWVTFTFIVKEIPQSWALLYVTFSPRWPHFWYLHKVKPFKSLESQSTSAWIQVFFMCNSYIIHSVEFETLWASTWNTKTLVIWTFSQMSDHNSFPHSSLEWICQLLFTHRGSQVDNPLATDQESVRIWHSVEFSYHLINST